MNKSVRLVLALIATLLLLTIVVLPQISEGKAFKWFTSKNISAADPARKVKAGQDQRAEITVGASIHNDTSKPLREMKQLPITMKPEREANENPKIPHKHKDSPDPVVQNFGFSSDIASLNMPATTLPGNISRWLL